MQIHYVRPHEIKLQGVSSAYAIPYWNLEGERIDFEAVEIIPAGHGERWA